MEHSESANVRQGGVSDYSRGTVGFTAVPFSTTIRTMYVNVNVNHRFIQRRVTIHEVSLLRCVYSVVTLEQVCLQQLSETITAERWVTETVR